MFCFLTKKIKAAIICAAFFIPRAHAQTPQTIESLQTKVSQLLSVNNKEKALQEISTYIRNEKNKNFRAEASDLYFEVAQIFLNKETQEHYESSLNDTLINPRSAQKEIEKCIAADALNLECHIQKTRLLFRSKNESGLGESLAQTKKLLNGTTYEKYFDIFAETNKTNFRELKILTSPLPPPSDKVIFLMGLELDRSLQAKNFSRAKDLILYIEKNYNDWPDLAYFKNKLDMDSFEKKTSSQEDLTTIYVNRCKGLSKTVARKYRYDFDLCNRGKK